MNAAVTEGASLGDVLKRLKFRELLIYLLLVALLILVGFTTHILFQYSIPQPNLVLLGNLTDFPVSTEPYHLVNEKADVYLFNTGENWLAFDLHTPATQQCRVRWVTPNRRFEDPCSGSKFARNGGYLEGPAWGHLDRYVGQATENGKLLIDLTAPLVETKVEFIQRCLIAQHSDAEPVLNGSWGDESDEQRCEKFWQTTSHKNS